MPAYHLTVTIHLLAALFWLGGIFFLAAVGAPALRRVEPPELRARLFREVGERFRTAGWIAIAVLIASGTAALHLRGLLRGEVLGDPLFWSGPLGRALGWKLGAVATMLLLQAVHDFVVGPRASRVEPGSARGRSLRRGAAWLARLSAVVGVGLVVAAVRLSRGG